MTETQHVPARRAQQPIQLASDTVTLKGLLEASSTKIAEVLPKHLTPDRLIRVALVAVSRSPDLQKCTVASILRCVMTGAQLGLDCSGVLGSAYMVPFNNKDLGVKEAAFIPGYRGLIDLARRSGEIMDIYAHPVFADDAFDFELGSTPKLFHKPKIDGDRSDKQLVCSYMVAYLKGHELPHIEVMPRVDIDKVRARSRAANNGPWVTDFAEMARKSVVRRGSKYLPVSVEFAEAITLDDEQYGDDVQVAAASTASGRARTADLLGSITGGGRGAASQDAPPQGDPDPIQDAPGDANERQNASGGDGGSDAPPAVNVDSWDSTRVALAEAGQEQHIPPSELDARVNLWLLSKGAKGKEDKKTTKKDRLALVEAVREGRLMKDGKIAETPPPPQAGQQASNVFAER